MTRLSDDEQIVQYIELRNNARVTGGSSIDSMSARDIDMDYTDDGQRARAGGPERRRGRGDEGIDGSGPSDSRRVSRGASRARWIDRRAHRTARRSVSICRPQATRRPAASAPTRSTAPAKRGRGLTMTEFRGNVEYREAGKRGAADRVVRSQSLTAMLADDAVTDAAFKGRVTFEEEGLNARAAEVRYQPRMNSLSLSGADARRRTPRLGRSDFHRRAHDRRRARRSSDRRH